MAKEDACFRGYVPQNATQIDDLPALHFDLIGYAPWVNGACSLKYLDSAATDRGNTRAMIFYTMTNGNTSAAMPSIDDPMWKIELHHYQFPIYAINGIDGEPLMNKIALYSGNMTDVWDSPGLAKIYDIGDYARVYIKVDTGMWHNISSELTYPTAQLLILLTIFLGSGNPLPGLWVFILIILGLLIFIFASTSLVMHLIQYRHRASLRRRVASGEVDLEAMGVKRLTVPLIILKKFPLRIYQTPPASLQLEETEGVVGRQSSSYPSHTFTQTNCAICLEEFESGISTRELPCLHIFHPECIDPHLSCNSSLCPLCKSSALPKGYVPPNLSNQTVRRERDLRRARERYAGMNGALTHQTQGRLGIINIARLWGRGLAVVQDNSPQLEQAGRSFSALPVLMQEEEEEWMNLSICKCPCCSASISRVTNMLVSSNNRETAIETSISTLMTFLIRFLTIPSI